MVQSVTHGCGSKLTRMIVSVASWYKGEFSPGAVTEGVLPDVNMWVMSRDRAGRVARVMMETAGEVRLSRFVDASGASADVQNIRYVGPDGVSRRWVFCGSCGDSMHADVVELATLAAAGCRRCGAGVSPLGCETPHGFGRCAACPQLVP